MPRGVEIELPIEIFHWLNGENASAFPHLLLVTDELAKVTVIEHFRSVNEHVPGFACGVNDLVCRPWREGDVRVRAKLGRQCRRVADEFDNGRS